MSGTNSTSSTASPATYTHGHHASVLRSHSWRNVQNSCGYLIPELKNDFRVLDVGCGPGTITVDLATYVPRGHVTGIEPEGAKDILDQARAHAAERRVTNVDFQVADVFNLPFADASFDLVHAHQVLQHISDPVSALREMRRVCKPGGLVAAREVDMGATLFYPEVPGINSWLDLYLRVARHNGGEPNAGRRLHAWARLAGFDPARMKLGAGTWCYATKEERDWWSGLWAERTLKSTFAKTALEGGCCDQGALEEAAKAWRRWGAEEDGWCTLIHGEVICSV
ncbi:S-adenosyl-L-methionine-dependent methyltransferase [Fimicolochytrium jonesii]|uniref:S-adenosyl-L-methionine-dependent methyltransferase n=1 Tax=Fimicolochytrium jonesii TaxID=1396493 RepID=UPI0022FE8C4E|nr:S-adenosyl-L-methionine-dependent methyltransferase [Fimicolochytrium jonesii]KAI8820989.1 S-adenosyl-L-methionine-dependent methyltransferase [Fimicolochytrium jonesii]